MDAEAIEQHQHALKLKPEHKGFKRTLESLKKQMSYELSATSYEPNNPNNSTNQTNLSRLPRR
jgi:hypothetical protein